MGKHSNKPAHSAKKPTELASAESLAELRSLDQRLYELRRLKNRHISSFISLITYPVIINLLFLQSFSPFKYMYEQKKSDYIHDGYHYVDGYMIANQKMLAGLNYAAQFINSELLSACGELIKNLQLAHKYIASDQINVQALLNDIPAYENSPMLSPSTHIFKAHLIKIIKYAINFMNSNINISVKPVSDAALATAPITMIYNLIIKFKNEMVINKDHPIFTSYVNDYAVEQLNWDIKTINVTVALLCQYFVTDPLLDRILNPTRQTNYRWLPQQQIHELISQKKEEEAQLTKYTKRNVFVARMAFGLLLPISIYLLANEDELSFPFLFTLFTTLATSLNYVVDEMKNAYAKVQFNKKLDNQINHWHLILNKQFLQIQSNAKNGQKLSATYFTLRIISRFKDVKPAELTRILKDLCIDEGIQVNHCVGNMLIIPAISGLDAIKATRIKDQFDLLATRHNEFEKLLVAVKLFKKHASNKFDLFYTKQFMEDNTRTIQLDFSMNANCRINAEEIRQLFHEANVIIEDDHDNKLIHLSISVIQPNHTHLIAHLDNMLQSLKPIHQPNRDTSYSNQQDADENGYKKSKESKLEDNNDFKETSDTMDVASTVEIAPRIVKFGKFGIYNSALNDNTIYPIALNKTKSKKSVRNTNLFITNSLNAVPDHIQQKVTEQIEAAALVASRGYQGLVPWHFKELDCDGNWFTPVAKLKLFKQGDYRVFFKAVSSNTKDATLWAAVGITENSHKKQQRR